MGSAMSKEWLRKGMIIHTSVVAEGWSGIRWNEYYKSNKILIRNGVREFLLSPRFVPSEKGTIYKIAIIDGRAFSSYSTRVTSEIRHRANLQKLITPPKYDVELLIEKKLRNQIKKMKLRDIVTMNKPIKDEYGTQCLICTDDPEENALIMQPAKFNDQWHPETGFAFIDSLQM